MNQRVLTILAILALAGAFPAQASAVIAESSDWMKTIMASMTPGQLTLLVLGVVWLLGK